MKPSNERCLRHCRSNFTRWCPPARIIPQRSLFAWRPPLVPKIPHRTPVQPGDPSQVQTVVERAERAEAEVAALREEARRSSELELSLIHI